MDNQEGKNILT